METLRYSSTGANVQLLQLALSRAGDFGGKIDGVFGNQTLTAVKSFQKRQGTAADGIVSGTTWARLMPYIKGYVTVTIKKGDTFWKLANEYGTTVRAIATANPAAQPQNLMIGQRITVPLGFELVPTDISYTYILLQNVVQGLAARYPFIAVSSLGRSVMGKELYSLKIGSGVSEVFYNAAFHANEWITTPVLLKFAEQYAKAYSQGGSVNGVSAFALYNTATLYIAPMVNPDGVDLVTGVLKSGSYYNRARQYSESYPSIPFPSGWKANISGVDLNLQFPAGWENARLIKFEQGFVSPAPRDFVGDAPLSAPESRAVYEFTLNHDFKLILAYHTQGEIIYWKYLDYLPDTSYETAVMMGQASGYTVEETPTASGYAGYKDWFIKHYNRPGYTIECGKGQNPLPISQFDKIYRDNTGILTLGITRSVSI